MIQRKTFIAALGGVLVGGMLLSGGMAIAGDAGSSISDKLTGKMPFFGKMMKHRGGMAGEAAQTEKQQQLSDTLKAAVGKGIISQQQSDKILKRFKDAAKEQASFNQKKENMTLKEIRKYMQDNKGKLRNPFQGLVSEGVITQKQLDGINSIMRDTVQKQQKKKMADGLKALVDKGTITQEQSDKIVKKIEAVQKEREALQEKIKNMTPEERRQYMQDNKEKPRFKNPISQLITDGTITREQADAIGKILPFQKRFKGGPGGLKGGFGGRFEGGFRGERQ